MLLKDHISVEMHKLDAIIGEGNYTNLYIFFLNIHALLCVA